MRSDLSIETSGTSVFSRFLACASVLGANVAAIAFCLASRRSNCNTKKPARSGVPPRRPGTSVYNWRSAVTAAGPRRPPRFRSPINGGLATIASKPVFSRLNTSGNASSQWNARSGRFFTSGDALAARVSASRTSRTQPFVVANGSCTTDFQSMVGEPFAPGRDSLTTSHSVSALLAPRTSSTSRSSARSNNQRIEWT